MSWMRSFRPSSSMPCQERGSRHGQCSPGRVIRQGHGTANSQIQRQFPACSSYIPATGGEAGTTKKQKFRAAAAMVGNLELVLPELEAQDITAKNFFVIHLGLSSLLVPAQRAWHLHNAQERSNHRSDYAGMTTPFYISMIHIYLLLWKWAF